MINKLDLLPHQSFNGEFLIEYTTPFHLLKDQSLKNPDKLFLIAPGIKEEAYSYSKFINNVELTSIYLLRLGLKKGNCINLIIPNSPEFLFLYFAAMQIGVTIVPINEDVTPREMLFIIDNCQAKAIFYHVSVEYKMDVIKSSFKSDKILELIEDVPNFRPLIQIATNSCYVMEDVSINDEAVIIYTSGTTGNPKGVVLTHFNLLADAKAISEWFHYTIDTRTLCILPLFHNNGQIVTLLAPLYAGGSTVIVRGKSSIMAFWGLIDKYQVTWTSVMASILSILTSLPYERKDNSMKGIICGGQVLTNSVQNAFEKRFNLPIFEGFGLTETTSFSCFNDYPANNRLVGSIGKPLPVNEMCIVDENDNELNPLQEGEICIRGLNVAKKYLGLEERNKNSFRNGWFHSGDYGYKDYNNYYFFKGRRDFLIIKGGENIYPAEIENVMYMHPAIAEIAVIGIPDNLLGQEIAAFIKLKENIEIREADLFAFCKDKLAKFKLPKKIIIINKLDDLNEIPKGPTKKILYNALSDYYINHLNAK